MLRRVGLVAIGVIVASLCASPANAQTTSRITPTLDVVVQPVLPGTRLLVQGRGWEPAVTVAIRVCGNLGLDGVVDCDTTSSVATFTWDDGTLKAPMTVVTPPSPCPCVILATPVDGARQATTPIDIIGAPRAAPATKAPNANGPTLKVTRASVARNASWTAVFGAAAGRTLVLEVKNTGRVPVEDVELTTAWGKGSDPRNVVKTPSVDTIAPGETVTVRVPFRLDATAVGAYSVRGDVGVVGNRVAFSTKTSQWPWGVLIVLALIVQGILLTIRNRVRHHAPPPDDDLPLGVEGVFDEPDPEPIQWSAPTSVA